MSAETRRPSLLKHPSEKLRRLLVEKRKFKTVHLHQGVTRMSHYPRPTLRHLQILKPGNRFPFLKGLLPLSLRSPCPSRRRLIYHEPKHLLHRQMAIQPSLVRVRGQSLLGNCRVLRPFLTVPDQQR